jgi:hypothetical protein
MSASSTPVNTFVIEPISNIVSGLGHVPPADHPSKAVAPPLVTAAANERCPRLPARSTRSRT